MGNRSPVRKHNRAPLRLACGRGSHGGNSPWGAARLSAHYAKKGMTINLGGRVVELLYMGPAQNPGDTLVYFPHAKSLYTGGPFSRKNWPNTSFTPSIDGWIATLKKVATMDIDQYLPGHGDVGSKQDLLDEAKPLGDLQAGIKAAIAKGMSREEMVKNLHFREYKELRNYDRLHGFIESTYNLLTTGKSAFFLP